MAALEGLTIKEGPDFPTGDKVLRKEDHQAFTRELVFVLKDGAYHLQEVIPWQKTVVPPACKLPAA